MYYLGHLNNSNLKWQDACRISLIALVSVFIYQYFQLPQGDWILYTVTFIYMGGVINGLALQRAVKRFYGAPLGFYAGFLFMGLFTYFDYRFNYLLPFIGVIAFLYFFMTGEYGIFIFFFMMFFMISYDLTSKEYADFNIFNLIYSRTFATFIGGLLIIFGELLIFPRSSNAVLAAKNMTEKIISQFSLAADTIADHAKKGLKLKHGYWNELSFLNKELAHFRQIINSYVQEADADEKISEALGRIHKGMIAVYDGIRILELACSYSCSAPDREFRDLLSGISSGIQNMQFAVPQEKLFSHGGMDEEYGLALKKISEGLSLLRDNIGILK